MNLQTFRESWFSNIKNDVLAGLVVSLALIPEAIAFSIIAGVDPMVGLSDYLRITIDYKVFLQRWWRLLA